MKRINCIVQEHQFSKDQIKEIEIGFRELYRTHYSDEKLNILWMILPEGYAFSERKPSDATVIMVEVDNDISKEKREEMMNLFSGFLLENYKISPLDSIITVANSDWVDAFFNAQKKRVSPLFRPLITFKTMWTALMSKRQNGFMRLRVRY